MADIVKQAKDIFGIQDDPAIRKQELQAKKSQGDATDRDRKELRDLDKKISDDQQ